VISEATARLQSDYWTGVPAGFEMGTVVYGMAAGLRTKNLAITEEVVRALDLSGIRIYRFHVELLDQF
jgi:hypothetical protein